MHTLIFEKFKLQEYIYLLEHCLSVSGRDIKSFFLLSHHFSLDCRPHIWKKGISYSFKTQILPKILPVMHIFSVTIMNYLKNSIGIKYLKRKICLAGLSPVIIPSPAVSCHLLPKDSKIKWF